MIQLERCVTTIALCYGAFLPLYSWGPHEAVAFLQPFSIQRLDSHPEHENQLRDRQFLECVAWSRCRRAAK